MKKTLLFLLLGCVCVVSRAQAQDSPENYHLEAAVMYWKPSSPEIVITSGSLATPVDFVNQFAIEEKWLPDFSLVLKGGKHKLRFNRMQIKYDGTATINQRISFQGVTYNVGIPTTAELKWTLMRLGYEYDFVSTPMGFAGVFTDVKFNKVNATLTASQVGSATFERNVPVPTIGGIARGYATQFVSFTGEFTGLKVNHGTFDAKFYDFDLYGTANFGRNVGAQIGYRSVTVDYTVDNDAGNMKLKGPYVGGIVRF
jgi:hypothetical protein